MDQSSQISGVEALIAEWECSARSAFVNAERYEAGSMERRAIEHGAMCYFNCAAALREAFEATGAGSLRSDAAAREDFNRASLSAGTLEGRREGKCPACGGGVAEWKWLESTTPSRACLICGAREDH